MLTSSFCFRFNQQGGIIILMWSWHNDWKLVTCFASLFGRHQSQILSAQTERSTSVFFFLHRNLTSQLCVRFADRNLDFQVQNSQRWTFYHSCLAKHYPLVCRTRFRFSFKQIWFGFINLREDKSTCSWLVQHGSYPNKNIHCNIGS